MAICTLYPATSPCVDQPPVLVHPYLPTEVGSDHVLASRHAAAEAAAVESVGVEAGPLDDEHTLRAPDVPEPSVMLLLLFPLAYLLLRHQRVTR